MEMFGEQNIYHIPGIFTYEPHPQLYHMHTHKHKDFKMNRSFPHIYKAPLLKGHYEQLSSLVSFLFS